MSFSVASKNDMSPTARSPRVIQVKVKFAKNTGNCFVCKCVADIAFAHISDFLTQEVTKKFCSSHCLHKYISKSIAPKIHKLSQSIINNKD